MSLRDYDWKISYRTSDDPLHTFYIPALQRSVSYDRSAGFFNSSALAVAATGVADLIRNNGRMRLLVGAQLSEEDVQAIITGQRIEKIVEQNLIDVLNQPVEEVLRQRWEVLASMVANDTLAIKVVLPVNQYGAPIPNALEYFHIKEGIFTDSNGDQISFSGSINESQVAWQLNYEQFSVYRSWESSRPYHQQCVHRFERLWNNKEDSWLAFDIPQAVKNRLIEFAPVNALHADPADQHDDLANSITHAIEEQLRQERLIFQFLRDLPYLIKNEQLGMATSAIQPWPHQKKVAEQIIKTYPQNYMLCDEVGLGKTIEAGLVLRQLLLTQTVKRCLLLVPRSVARQWQEELYEKFVLDIPLFDGKHFKNYNGEQLEPDNPHDSNPWNHFDIFIATSHLAKHKNRHPQLCKARGWDLIMVDEAHHARRKDFLQENSYRPNNLLSLLTDPQLHKQSILLMTATPMQVHPVEVWDLLKVLGLGGKWGADSENFMQFFRELRQNDFSSIEWDFIFEMVGDFLNIQPLDPAFSEDGRKALGSVTWKKVADLPYATDVSTKIKRLATEAQPYVRELARRHTPLRHYMFRNTRDLLREYVKQGILDANVPHRAPELIWIPMRENERDLYNRIEEYISQFYRKYQNKRTGLGFIMTVYRRRLTSSFYAVRKSLERRLAFLEEQPQNGEWMTDEDFEEDSFEESPDDPNSLEGEVFQDEINYVKDFLSHLNQLFDHDSKTEQLFSNLRDLFLRYNTVIVFTQYTDTLDYLRAKLLDVYHDQVACYSGRGGELWNGIGWVGVSKEEIKQKFRVGDEVKILLCTEAASEGLNLQTCGVLINYDMPWNPMRVEQRIGRIDRIGQTYGTVLIKNYFYEDTIEARVYQALSNRIDWFENVVGNLQPILVRIGQVIKDLVMTTQEEREEKFEQAMAELETSLDEQSKQDILEVYESTATADHDIVVQPPITLMELETFIIQSQHLASVFKPHPKIDRAFILSRSLDEAVGVTFDPQTFDNHPNSLQMLSFGNALFKQLLDEIPAPNLDNRQGILHLSTEIPGPRVGFYTIASTQKGQLIKSYHELVTAIASSAEVFWSDAQQQEAIRAFEKAVSDRQNDHNDVWHRDKHYQERSIAEQANQILVRVATIDMALIQVQSPSPSPLETLTPQDVLQLERHGKPFEALLYYLNEAVNIPERNHFQDIAEMNKDQLNREFDKLKTKANELLNYLKHFQDNTTQPPKTTAKTVSRILR